MSQQPPNAEQTLSVPDFSAFATGPQSQLPRRRLRWKPPRVIVIIALVLLLIVAGVLLFPLIRGHKRTVTYQFQSATQGNFSLSVNATGPLQSAVYNLVFSGSGTIAEIDVAVGQTVTQNQVLAKLNQTSLQDALNAAQAGILAAQTAEANAESNLSQTESQSNANLQAAQTALANAQASLSTTEGQSQASVVAASITLNDDMVNLGNVETQSQASIAAAQTALNNDESNLRKTKITAQADINLAFIQEQQAIIACNTPTPTPTPVPTPAPTAPATPVPTSTSSSTTNIIFTIATITPAQCVKLAKAQYQQAVDQANASVATAQAQVNSDQKQLTLTQQQANANIATAQNQVNNDQQQLELTEAQAGSNNTTAQNQVSTASNALTTAKANAGANNTNGQGLVNTAQTQFQTALVALQTAQHNLANAILRAPHDGIVTAINGTVGGTPGVPANSTATSTSGSTFIQISDPSSLQVEADVNESDTALMKVGDPVQFTVSAYSNRLFTGVVSGTTPTGQTVSNVVTYPVTIDVNMNDLQGATLLPGMTASVTIVVAQRPDVVLIPVNAINFARSAISTVNGVPALISRQQAVSATEQARQMLRELELENPSVLQDSPTPAYVLERPSGQTAVIPVPVVLGLTDDTFYVVLQGLSAGDIIVVGAQNS